MLNVEDFLKGDFAVKIEGNEQVDCLVEMLGLSEAMVETTKFPGYGYFNKHGLLKVTRTLPLMRPTMTVMDFDPNFLNLLVQSVSNESMQTVDECKALNRALDTSMSLVEAIEDMQKEIDVCKEMSEKYQDNRWSSRIFQLTNCIQAIEAVLV